MIVYRIENPDTMHGMWYRIDGTFDPFIETLTDGKSADLPMEWDERYSAGGRQWFSGCHSIELMRHWFTDLDALELYEAGYHLFKFDVTEYNVEEFQTIFTREGIVSREEIPLETIWNIDNLSN